MGQYETTKFAIQFFVEKEAKRLAEPPVEGNQRVIDRAEFPLLESPPVLLLLLEGKIYSEHSADLAAKLGTRCSADLRKVIGQVIRHSHPTRVGLPSTFR